MFERSRPNRHFCRTPASCPKSWRAWVNCIIRPWARLVGPAVHEEPERPILRWMALFVLGACASSMQPAWAGPAWFKALRRNETCLVFIQQGNGDFSVENVVGPPGTPLPIRVKLGSSSISSDPDREDPAVMFSGLPEGFRLSAGTKKMRAWSVSIDKLNGLMLIPPPAYEGDFKILAMFFDGKDIRDMRTIPVSIHRKPASAPVVPALSPGEEDALLKRGNALLKNGDVSAARLNFETLAARGSAIGAFALAQSYDPEFLKTLPIAGLRPDVAKAREWYRKAAELGSKEAAVRLSALSGGASGSQIPTQ